MNRNLVRVAPPRSLLAVTLLIPFSLNAQSRPAFDAVSIKPAASALPDEGANRSRIDFSPTRLTLRNVNLSECVQWAWNARFFQVSIPDSHNDSRYDIVAVIDTSSSRATLRLMLQSALEQRFQIKLHREMKPTQVYLLVEAKGGSRLPKPDLIDSLTDSVESMPRVQNGSLIFPHISMKAFAEKLSDLRGIDRPVLDRTGINGAFDITLKSAADAIMQADGPSLFNLLQEQLGLRLTPSREPMETFVVDSASKPTEN